MTPQFGFSFLIAEIEKGNGLGFNQSEQYKTNGFRANFNIPLEFKMKIM